MTAALHPVLRQLQKLAGLSDAERLRDGELLERFVRGRDETAFEALVRRHGPSVLGVGRRVLHDANAAEDVFQATFLVLARRAGRLDRRGSLGSWLHVVAFRLALKAKAGRRREATMSAEPVTVADPLAELTGRELVELRWGIVPAWKHGSVPLLINARAETAATKPTFRKALQSRRCLIPATGFYEWQKTGRQKQPLLFRLAGGACSPSPGCGKPAATATARKRKPAPS
jgi:RNA polymerase sigma factor (sigma-70 family)